MTSTDYPNACILVDEKVEKLLTAKGFGVVLPKGKYVSIRPQKDRAGWPRCKKRRSEPTIVNVHSWVAASVWGERSNASKMQATHICGNDKCVAACHIRYQSADANRADHKFHSVRNGPHTSMSVSRLSWSVNEGTKV